MPALKNPFPTVATPRIEQVADVQGMEVHRISGADWTRYVVEDPRGREPSVKISIDRASYGGFHFETYARPSQQYVAAGGRALTLSLKVPTRRQAELKGFRTLVRLARELNKLEAFKFETEESLLGLEAPLMMKRSRSRGRRAHAEDQARRARYEST